MIGETLMIQRLTKEYIQPVLKPLGFKTKALFFNRSRGEFVDVITLQRAEYSTASDQKITANLGVCVPEFVNIMFDKPRSFWTEAESVVRFRLSAVLVEDYTGLVCDRWWDLNTENLEAVGAEFRELIVERALPILESFADFRAVENHLQQKRGWIAKDAFTLLNRALVNWKIGDLDKCEEILSAIKGWEEKTEIVRQWIRQHPR